MRRAKSTKTLDKHANDGEYGKPEKLPRQQQAQEDGFTHTQRVLDADHIEYYFSQVTKTEQCAADTHTSCTHTDARMHTRNHAHTPV